MRLVWMAAAAVLLGSGISAHAQEKPVGGLTAKEISEGWIRLFDGETTFGWTPRGDANWTIENGMVQASTGNGFLCTNTEFADYELRAECWIDDKANSGIFLRVPVEGDITTTNAYECNIYDAHPKWPTGSINDIKRGSRKVKTAGRWSAFAIRAEGEKLTIAIDGKKILDAKDSKLKRGVIALQHFGDGTVKFRNIALKPLTLKSLLNGKDLTGWKPLGQKSVFSATKEGWLNIKNGPDEIQSEAQFGDFVLQLEIFSNGDHLNSGVFFREDPGAFWGGYEAQVRNQWQGDDRAKPVDFGTGGLYFYQPSRKVVSSDREWFTYTIVAAGKHLSTWINGFQTADFLDKRPETDKSARGGARTKPGVFGLQGHDPTTDLTFRNIHAAELPAK